MRVILRRLIPNTFELAAADAHDGHPDFIMKLRITFHLQRAVRASDHYDLVIPAFAEALWSIECSAATPPEPAWTRSSYLSCVFSACSASPTHLSAISMKKDLCAEVRASSANRMHSAAFLRNWSKLGECASISFCSPLAAVQVWISGNDRLRMVQKTLLEFLAIVI